ncbi:MAG: hypothetical protein VKP70_06580 [Cyanobacteriota bacterium]|nr:hypothetical protein [Cyanobacteriota bacterium]
MLSRMTHHQHPRRPFLLLAGGLTLALLLATPLKAASALLERVKRNPALAKSLCAQFKQLNAAGRSATSRDSIAMVASSQGLSQVDAEVLTTYVIGLHCPDVR